MNSVLREYMGADPRYLYMGEDVRFATRGVAKGLVDEFGPDRVLDCPISEQGFTGVATGLAMAGYRPIVEYQITALLYVAFDQLVDQAQKMSFITGGQTAVPVTYLMAGSGWRPGIAGQHADNPYALLVHCGMKTGIPVAADDAAGMLRAALDDPDPVMLFLPAACLPSRGEISGDVAPIGTGRIARPGTDISVCAIGPMVNLALEAAEAMELDGVSVEVIDPRWLLPFDYDLLRQSIRKTGRLVVCDDASRSCGIASEIAASVHEMFPHDLRAPVERLTRPDVPMPFAPTLESAVVPNVVKLCDAIRRALRTTEGTRR
ncbi:MAG TPA: transketolase C-terminal domain-containing protein [Candidatus Saccharimonadales bacterium]|nr:transketolase C-terminal domain-containing protein [Candidatus Saccharimonadales bacterium]